MVTMVWLVNDSLIYTVNILNVCVIRTIKIYSPGKFQVYNIELVPRVVIYIGSPELIHWIIVSLVIITDIGHLWDPGKSDQSTL